MVILERRNFYFNKFPIVNYDLGEDEIEVLNFIHRWKIKDVVRNNASVYSKWTMRDSDTLRGMAYKLYGSEHFYWIIMMMNNIVDPYYGVPFDEKDFNSYVKGIYGADAIYNHHHWESEKDDNLYSLPEGYEVSEDYPYNKISISNYDYLSNLNENKRLVRLLKPEYLSQIKLEKDTIIANYQ